MELFTKDVLATLPGSAGATWFIVWLINTFTPLTGKVLIVCGLVIGEIFFWLFMMPKPPVDHADWVLAILNGSVVGLSATGADQLFKKSKSPGVF